MDYVKLLAFRREVIHRAKYENLYANINSISMFVIVVGNWFSFVLETCELFPLRLLDLLNPLFK